MERGNMKTIVVDNKESKEIEYPWLGVTSDGLVVLFHDKNCGIVVYKPTDYPCPNKLGDYHATWQMVFFEPFTGTLTLSND